jgi:zinc/manganese transport system substrate-binding protein
MQATSEGNDPSARDLAAFNEQVTQHRIRVLVYNTQTENRTTENLRQLAVRDGIPVVGISETIQPSGASFQTWQIAQLDRLQQALATAQ